MRCSPVRFALTLSAPAVLPTITQRHAAVAQALARPAAVAPGPARAR